MNKPRVTVLRNKFVRGFPDPPGVPEGERGYPMTLAKALNRPFTSDAHFAQYTARSMNRRLSGAALTNGVVAGIDVFVLDVDCEETHGKPEPAPESWRMDMRQKMHALYEAHPDAYYYETKGGARIVYRMPERFKIETQEHAKIWAQRYAVILAYMERRFSIVADPACADWTRLFRLPHATRTPGAAPEDWVAIGDADNVGTLEVEASVEDLSVAMSRSKLFTVRQDLNLTPCTADGHGLLFHALQARGYVLRERPGGGYFIKCPRESQHSSGKTGDTSSILYLPAVGTRPIGSIHCMHSHCVNLKVSEWLKEFSRDELKAAEVAAGIVQEKRNA